MSNSIKVASSQLGVIEIIPQKFSSKDLKKEIPELRKNICKRVLNSLVIIVALQMEYLVQKLKQH